MAKRKPVTGEFGTFEVTSANGHRRGRVETHAPSKGETAAQRRARDAATLRAWETITTVAFDADGTIRGTF